MNCVWSEHSLDADGRSHYALCTGLNNALDRADGLGFVHRNGFGELPSDSPGAVVIIHGGHQGNEVEQLVRDVGRLGWAVTIVIGDEEGVFPSGRFTGNRRKLWIQMPVPGVHDGADRRMICGFPHDCPIYLMSMCREMEEKPLDWAFAGQINHASRRACVARLKTLPNGFLYESPQFWHGIDRGDYYRKLAEAKIAPCPSGSATPDTLRVAEALEAGCIPVAEDGWPPGRRLGMTGYWRYVLGENPPFPTLTDWRTFPAVLERLLREWPAGRDRLQIWWAAYKRRMESWLIDDIRAVEGLGVAV